MSRYEKYGSHIGCLKALTVLKPYKSVLEFGCGDFSTKYFVESCDEVTSIEMNDEAWFNKVSANNPSDKLDIVFYRDQEALKFASEDVGDVDLIFVDGNIREDCVNMSFGKAPVIVVHDIGLRALRCGWLKNIKKNGDYDLFIWKNAHPSTAVFTCDANLKITLKNSDDFIRVNW